MRCKLSAEASIVLTAPAASDRKEGKPRSIPAAVPAATLLQELAGSPRMESSARLPPALSRINHSCSKLGTKDKNCTGCTVICVIHFLPSSSAKKKKKKKSQDTLSTHKQQVILIPEGNTSFSQLDYAHSDVPPALEIRLPYLRPSLPPSLPGHVTVVTSLQGKKEALISSGG